MVRTLHRQRDNPHRTYDDTAELTFVVVHLLHWQFWQVWVQLWYVLFWLLVRQVVCFLWLRYSCDVQQLAVKLGHRG